MSVQNGGHNKRQYAYLAGAGQATESCTDAVVYSIVNGQLWANSSSGAEQFSTETGLGYSNFTPSASVGELTTVFSVDAQNNLLWSNANFYNNRASFCVMEDSTLVAVFDNPANGPQGCLFVSLSLTRISNCAAAINGPVSYPISTKLGAVNYMLRKSYSVLTQGTTLTLVFARPASNTTDFSRSSLDRQVLREISVQQGYKGPKEISVLQDLRGRSVLQDRKEMLVQPEFKDRRETPGQPGYKDLRGRSVLLGYKGLREMSVQLVYKDLRGRSGPQDRKEMSVQPESKDRREVLDQLDPKDHRETLGQPGYKDPRERSVQLESKDRKATSAQLESKDHREMSVPRGPKGTSAQLDPKDLREMSVPRGPKGISAQQDRRE
jgi:hypothetical protein